VAKKPQSQDQSDDLIYLGDLTPADIPPGRALAILRGVVTALHRKAMNEQCDTIVIVMRDSNGEVGVGISPPTDDMSDEETTALTQQLLVDALARVAQGNPPKCPDCGEVH
jgi:hypothetical protein